MHLETLAELGLVVALNVIIYFEWTVLNFTDFT